MPKTTQESVDQLRALLAKATPGPWKRSNYRPNLVLQRDQNESTYLRGDNGFPSHVHTNSPEDAAFIVACRNLLPQLLEQYEAMAAHKGIAEDAATEFEMRLNEAEARLQEVVEERGHCPDCRDSHL